ncbi:MAG: cupin domain-containing protein [Candidatus Nitrosocosmicus sp.]
MVINGIECNKSDFMGSEDTYEKIITQQYSLNGLNFIIHVSGIQTQGSYSIIEVIFPINEENEISLHKHSREDVLVYVLSGNFLFKNSTESIHGEKGTVIKFTKGIPHSYSKIGKESEGRLLIVYTPAGFESFFKEIESSHVYGRTDTVEYDPIMLQLLEKRYGWRLLFE